MAWLPRTLFGRLVLLMAAGLLLAQLLGAALHLSELRRTVGRTVSQELAQRITAVYHAIDSQHRSGARSRLAQACCRTPRQQLTLEIDGTAGRALKPRCSPRFVVMACAALLGPGVAVRARYVVPRIRTTSSSIFISGLQGRRLAAYPGQCAPDRNLRLALCILLVNLGVMLLMVFILVWLVVRMTVRPLTRLAGGARSR
jgi:hypothetical protein